MTNTDPTNTTPQDWSELLADAGPSDLARALLQPEEPVPDTND